MTMLDRMRRHKGMLKWTLVAVVLAFVVFYIPDFLQPTYTGVGAAPGEVVAEVGGIELTLNGTKLSWSIASYLSALQSGVLQLLEQP